MCGICGFTGFEDKQILNDMISTLHHRGPDGSGSFSNGIVSLGHTRLSIIDLSDSGHQPMSNEDETIWITYNGEIYNHIWLKKQLSHSHQFRSHCDTEVIVHAYEECGFNFIQKSRSMFALALYDENKNKLFLARDHLGKKPLYYYFDGEVFIFASEIKAILAAKVKRTINEAGLASYLRFGYTTGSQTIFKGIKKVPAGHLLTLDLETNVISLSQYWDIKENITNHSLTYYVNKLRSLLETSAKMRTVADVPIGAFLSGGLDSSAVVGLTNQWIEYPFHTFSMGFQDYHSELNYAQLVAEHFDTCHHEIELDADMALNMMERISWHYDEPISDAAVIANYYLSKEAAKYVKVVVAGEAGDEIFGGYDSYKRILNSNRISKISLIPRKLLRKICINIIDNNHQNNDLRAYKFVKSNILEDFTDKMIHMNETMSEEDLFHLTTGKVEFDEKSMYMPHSQKKLNMLLEFDCKNLLSEKFLMKADKATMGNSIEERLPLIDRSIVDFMFTIPTKFKINKGCEKFILKEAVKDILPHEIIMRKKEGFGVPFSDWIQKEKKEIFESELASSSIISKYVSSKEIEKIFYNAYINNDSKSFSIMWNLYSLSIWNRVFMG